MDIGENIKKYRKAYRMTQEQLAKATGVRVLSIKKWEAGTHIPTVKNAQALADVFGITVSELCGVEDPSKTTDFVANIDNNKVVFIEEVMKMDDETFSHLQKYFEFLKRGGS